jgi:hypothetical protein
MGRLLSRRTNWGCVVALVGAFGRERVAREFLEKVNASDTRSCEQTMSPGTRDLVGRAWAGGRQP